MQPCTGPNRNKLNNSEDWLQCNDTLCGIRYYLTGSNIEKTNRVTWTQIENCPKDENESTKSGKDRNIKKKM